MKNKFIITLIAGMLISFSTYSVTIDLRQEYSDNSKILKSRALISHRFNNGFGFSLENKWQSSGKHADRPFNDIISNGNESTISYQHQVNQSIYFQPDIAFENSTDKSNYMPSLRTHYKINEKIYIAARYRYEYIRNTKKNIDDEHINRGDIWLGYKVGKWRYEYNFIYKYSDQLKFNNTHEDYEHDLKIAYVINKNWTPYYQIGNHSVRKTTNERQTRLRIGVQYSF